MSKKGCQSTRLQITPWNLGDQKREQEKLSTALIMKINWDSQRPEKLCTMYYILPAHPISWFPILGISLLLIKEAEEESWIHRQLYGNFLPHPTMTGITKICPQHIRPLFFVKEINTTAAVFNPAGSADATLNCWIRKSVSWKNQLT